MQIQLSKTCRLHSDTLQLATEHSTQKQQPQCVQANLTEASFAVDENVAVSTAADKVTDNVDTLVITVAVVHATLVDICVSHCYRIIN